MMNTSSGGLRQVSRRVRPHGETEIQGDFRDVIMTIYNTRKLINAKNDGNRQLIHSFNERRRGHTVRVTVCFVQEGGSQVYYYSVPRSLINSFYQRQVQRLPFQ